MCEKKRGERQTRGGLKHKGTKSWQDSDGEATPTDKTQNCPTNTS